MKNLKKTLVLIATLVAAVALLASCSKKDDKTIKVAATPSPHAEVLEQIKDVLAEDGWTLEIVEFEDYVKPNQAVEDGDVDANYFQHQPYLDQYNEENKTKIVSAGVIHYEAMGIYKGKKSELSSLSSGDKVGVPNDVTNEARALALLEANGVIKLKEGVGLNATKADIVSNPYGVEIVELDAAIIPNTLPDLAFGVINGNYALNAKLTSANAVAFEASDSTAAQTYANIIACKKSAKNSKKIKALVKAIQSDTVKNYIEKEYGGIVKVVF